MAGGLGGEVWGEGLVLCREASYHQRRVRRKTVWVVHCAGGPPPRSKVRGGRGVPQTGDFRWGRIKGLPHKKADGALAQARQASAGQKRAPAADFLLLCSQLLQFLRGRASASVVTPRIPTIPPAGTNLYWPGPLQAPGATPRDMGPPASSG